MTENFIDFYEILDVSIKATKKEIAEKYNEFLINEQDEEKRRIIDAAYEVLSDDDRRKKYNEVYVATHLNVSSDDEEQGALEIKELNYEKEDIDSIVSATKNRFNEFNLYVSELRNKKDPDIEYKREAALKSETFYKKGMWPLLGKLKEVSGEDSLVYISVCQLHSRAILSLGDFCMWAEIYDRAIGMYNTALALSADNADLAEQCVKASSLARRFYEDATINENYKKPENDESTVLDELFVSYFDVTLWVVAGFIFATLSLWGTICLLDFIFLI